MTSSSYVKMEDIAFSDWPGQPVDLSSGGNPWLPAYGFQTPSALLDKEDFIGNPDADYFLQGNATNYMYLETIQEETSDDLRSDSDFSSRDSPVGWLATDSETGSVICIDTPDDVDCESDREIACPAKRRKQDNFLTVRTAIEDDNQSLSRSSSLLQFETLEKQCQETCSSSPSVFSQFSFDSLENHRKNDVSPDSLERAQSDNEQDLDYYRSLTIDIPRKKSNKSRDSLLYSARYSGSESSDSEGTLDASRSFDNLKTWRSFDSLPVTSNCSNKNKDKVSAENLSEDSGYSDHLYGNVKHKSNSLHKLDKVEEDLRKYTDGSKNSSAMKNRNNPDSFRFSKKDIKVKNSYVEFSAYDGEVDIAANFASHFGTSYHDLTIFDKYEPLESYIRSPLIDRFVKNKKRLNVIANVVADPLTKIINIEKASSECGRSSKYNCPSASEPNLLRAVSCSEHPTDKRPHSHHSFKENNLLENSFSVCSVPKDLNLLDSCKSEKCENWTFEASESVAAKNFDLADLTSVTPSASDDTISDVFLQNVISKIEEESSEQLTSESSDNIEEFAEEEESSNTMRTSRLNHIDNAKPSTSRDKSTESESPPSPAVKSRSFRREGSYAEAMSNRVDLSDDETSLTYKPKPKNTLEDFDRKVLKAISETSLQSLHKSVADVHNNEFNALQVMFQPLPTVNRIPSQKRNNLTKSTPNLNIYKNDLNAVNIDNYIQDDRRRSAIDIRPKSSLVNSTSNSGMSDSDDKTLVSTKSFSGSTSSKGVHFSPVVDEVKWRDDDASTATAERESSYSLTSTPERERSPAPPERERSPPRERKRSPSPERDLTPPRTRQVIRPTPRKASVSAFTELPHSSVSASQPHLADAEVKHFVESLSVFRKELSKSQPDVYPARMKRRGSQMIKKDRDGCVIQAYVDVDGIQYKHTHLKLDTVYKSPTAESHVVTDVDSRTRNNSNINIAGSSSSIARASGESGGKRQVMETHVASRKDKRAGKLGGFFHRLASFRFSLRKASDEKAKLKKKNTGTNLNISPELPAHQRIASKEDYIYIPLKGPGDNNNREKSAPAKSSGKVNSSSVTGNNNSGNPSPSAFVSGKPPLPRVVGASVKRDGGGAQAGNTPQRVGGGGQVQQSTERQRRRTIDLVGPRPMEPMGLIETDLDTEVTVITSGAHCKTRSLLDLGSDPRRGGVGLSLAGGASHQGTAAHPQPSRPHKSMEFLLDKQNLKVVEPPENELQKGERVMSEHQLRVQRSLQKLTIPDWYKASQVPKEGFLLKKHAARDTKWNGTGSRTTSLSSLGSCTQSPVILSPTPQNQPFVRWSTSKLNSTASSPCASTRSSFNARQTNGSISPSSVRSSFSYRQPYLGWRSQERLSRPRTPAERLANTILSHPAHHHPQESPEIQTSIKEVTSAIVHYVSGLKPDDGRDRSYESQETASQRSSSVSPRGSQKLCWLESSFVGTRPLDSPQTPITLSESQSSTPAPPINLRLDLQTPNDVTLLNTSGSKPSPGSTTLEDVLDSLLGLPSSGRAPSPSLQETVSANTSPSRIDNYSKTTEQFRRWSEGSQSTIAQSSGRRVSFNSSPILRCRNTNCGRTALAATADGQAYKNCHNCSYTYCSRTCRRAHWEKHRKTCLFSRVGSLCRQVIAACKEQTDTLLHLSQMARRGYLSHGPGAVKCFFPCPESAEQFLSHGYNSLGELTYIRWQDLQPSEMGPHLYAELVKMCKNYNPDSKLVLYVSICVISETPSVKWERQLVSRCAKMRLSKDVPIPEKEPDNPETLILTSKPMSNVSDKYLKEFRERCVSNVQRELRERGVSLRKKHPAIYKQLTTYAIDMSVKFTPVTVYPTDVSTGKSFLCIIMLEADDDSLQQVITAGVRVRTIDVSRDSLFE